MAGDADAQLKVGEMYARGEGIPENNAEAVRWFRMAAEQGNSLAQFNLAVMYARGEGGLLKSGATAAEWYYKAGLAYLGKGDRDNALLCVERIADLKDKLGLTVPNAFLGDQLLHEIYSVTNAPGR